MNNTMKYLYGALLSMALPLCGMAGDSYIYWMIDQSSSPNPYSFYAASMVTSDGEILDTVYANGVQKEGDLGVKTDEVATSLSPGYESLSFIIELYLDESWTPTYYSVWRSFADVTSHITDDPVLHPVNGMNVSYFSTLPEPTSGVLLLIGLAALGLKRRKL